MARHVQIEVEFEVDDDVTNQQVESIWSDALVQIDEAVDRDEEVDIPTTVTAYALTVDGTIIATYEAPSEPSEDAEHLYEKCADCHLFVEVNAAAEDFDPSENIQPFDHLHRGTPEDEALDSSHEPRPSGMKATLATWRAYGPEAMRARFTDDPR